jgi:hypothetical protein
MAKQEETSKSARILYRPVGLTSSVVGGLLAGIVFKQVWRRATPGDRSDPPTALESEYGLKEVLIAATSRGPSSPLSRPSSTAAVPGPSNDGPANGPVDEAIPHA